eukprot:SAG31_NODE_362_length_16904_cov_7.893218_2_plen_128_part_00
MLLPRHPCHYCSFLSLRIEAMTAVGDWRCQVEALTKYDARSFVFESTFMCNTELIQAKLKAVGRMHKVPGTYPKALDGLLNRKCEQRSFSDVTEEMLPVFIKPVSNDKRFDGASQPFCLSNALQEVT